MTNHKCVRQTVSHAMLPVALAIGLAFSGMSWAQTAPESTAPAGTVTRHNFDLAPAPLATTLRKIAEVSGRRIAFEPSIVADRMSGPVRGVLAADDAVRAALQGTGLELASEADALRVVTRESRLERVVITAQRDPAEFAFKAGLSDTATRSRTDLMDVPGSITMLTAKVLETQQVLDVREALGNVSGIGVRSDPQGGASFSVRGFGQGSGLVNGLGGSSATPGIDSIERIEVLKGPQSILQGADGLGGVVNLVLKKPTTDPVRQVAVQVGSFADRVLSLDLADAIDTDKKWSWRLNASTARAGEAPGGLGYDGRQADSVLPQLRFKTAETDVVLGAVASRVHNPVPAYTMAVDGRIRSAPTTPLGNTDDGFDTRSRALSYNLEHHLNDTVTLVSRLNHDRTDFNIRAYSPAFPLDPAFSQVMYFPAVQRREDRGTTGDHYLRLSFTTGALDHKLSVGVNHSNTSSDLVGYSGGDAAFGLPVDPFATVPTVFPPLGGDPAYQTRTTSRQRGVYVQDLIALGDFNVSLGARRTSYRSVSISSDPTTGAEVFRTSTEQSVTTPSVGVVYKLQPTASVYASYNEGFIAATGVDCNLQPLKPLQTRNKEAGLKLDLLGGRLGTTFSVFELQQQNASIFDLANSCDRQITAQKNTGFEFDLQGQIAKGWNMLANYTYTRYTAPAEILQVASAGFSKQMASVWSTYDFQSERLRDWGVGVGMVLRSRSEGSFFEASRFQVPGSVRVDGSVVYRQPGWSLTLGLKDIFDAVRYEPAVTDTFVPLAKGRTFTLTLRANFK